MTSVCQNMSYDTSYWEENGGTNFLDVPSKNVLLAIIPKVGCTNWKKVIMFLENKISPITKQNVLQKGDNFQKIHLLYVTPSLGLAKAISGTDATNFARDREFQKMSDDEKDNLVNTRKTMLVIREPLQRQDFEFVTRVN